MKSKKRVFTDMEQELKKCYEDPLYYYNTYVNTEDHEDVTQQEYDELTKRLTWLRQTPTKDNKYKEQPKDDFGKTINELREKYTNNLLRESKAICALIEFYDKNKV